MRQKSWRIMKHKNKLTWIFGASGHMREEQQPTTIRSNKINSPTNSSKKFESHPASTIQQYCLVFVTVMCDLGHVQLVLQLYVRFFGRIHNINFLLIFFWILTIGSIFFFVEFLVECMNIFLFFRRFDRQLIFNRTRLFCCFKVLMKNLNNKDKEAQQRRREGLD